MYECIYTITKKIERFIESKSMLSLVTVCLFDLDLYYTVIPKQLNETFT